MSVEFVMARVQLMIAAAHQSQQVIAIVRVMSWMNALSAVDQDLILGLIAMVHALI
tara:strand:- start:1309 stop:1476 length:168 start_codon:yes stop_codon:yes gene_type:complete